MDELQIKIQDNLRKIGLRLRELRKEKGFSGYDEFAYENKLNRSTYGRMEKGYNMRMDTFLTALEALDISLEEFFKGIS